MGAAVSSNENRTTTEIITKVVTDLVRDTYASGVSNQVIDISGADKVVIDHFTMESEARVDIKALLTYLSKRDVRDQISQDISQAAKSKVSGINLAQFADSSNVIEDYVKGMTQVFESIKDSCSSLASATQTIRIRHAAEITIKDSSMRTLLSVLANCVNSSVSNNRLLTSADVKLRQTASSVAAGIDLSTILLAVAALVAAFMFPLATGASSIVKYLFPIVFLAGGGLLAAYFFWTQETLASTYFPRLPVTCTRSPPFRKDVGKTWSEAVESCKADPRCKLVAFKGTELVRKGGVVGDGDSSKGSHYRPLPASETVSYYYADPGNCPTLVTKDEGNFVAGAYRVEDVGPGRAGGRHLVAIQPKSVEIQSLKTSTWDKLSLPKEWSVVADLTSLKMTSTEVYGPGDGYYLRFDEASQTLALVLKKGTSVARMGPPLSLPPLVFVPTSPNAIAFKVSKKRPYLLYIGLAAMAAGLVGTLFFGLGGSEAEKNKA